MEYLQGSTASKRERAVWPSAKGTAKRLKISQHSASRAMVRMTGLGMLVRKRWQVMPGRKQPSLLRRVMVTRSRDKDGKPTGWWRIPRAVAARLVPARPTRGGARPLAGRPRGGDSKEQARARRLTALPLMVTLGAFQKPLKGKIKKAHNPSSKELGIPIGISFLGRKETRCAAVRSVEAAAAVQSISGGEANKPPTQHRDSTPVKLPPPSKRPEHLFDESWRATVPSYPKTGHDFGLHDSSKVSPLPHTGVVGRFAQVPEPPLLDPERSDDEHIAQLLKCHQGCVESRYKGRCFVRVTRRSKLWLKLVEAVTKLVEHEVSPAAWAMFSIDIWQQHHGSKQPPLAWVWSVSRIEEHHGWFHSEECHYRGGLIVQPASMKELVERWKRVNDAARCGVDTAAAAELYFPGDLYQRLVERARSDIPQMQAWLNERMSRGDWLWGW
jgi:hypothetical protein